MMLEAKNVRKSFNGREVLKGIDLGVEKGEVIAEKDTVRTSFRELLSGMRELIRIAGTGGVVDAWIPSEEAYGSEGNNEKGIKPDQLLNFEISILNIELRNRK